MVMMSKYSFCNDTLGRRTAMSRTGSVFTQTDTLSYSYNDRSEVVGAVSDEIQSYNYAYAFDNIGNRINSSEDTIEKLYTSNSLNQYSSITNPTVSPTYDDDGNMLTNDDWTYAWDMENRLISVENTTTRLEFKYDRMSRRIEKKVYDNETLVKHVKFIYRGYKLIEERDGLNDDATLRQYSWQPIALDAPLYVKDFALDATYYYHTDANKNVTELTDSTGTIVAHYEYSPFGAITSATGSYASTNPFCFSSEYGDIESDLIYYNYRYYSPTHGRWLSRDPIAEKGGWNLYEILTNNILNQVDIRGLAATVQDHEVPDTFEELLEKFPSGNDDDNLRRNLAIDIFMEREAEKDKNAKRCCGKKEYDPRRGECCLNKVLSTVGKEVVAWKFLNHSSHKECIISFLDEIGTNAEIEDITTAYGFDVATNYKLKPNAKFSPGYGTYFAIGMLVVDLMSMLVYADFCNSMICTTK